MNVRSPVLVVASILFTAAILALGYLAFGPWVMLIFTSGFLGGLVLWLFFPVPVAFASIRAPYWTALALFAAHRVEEYATDFFAKLASITGTPKPDAASWEVVLLVALSVGGWLLVPALTKRRARFGHYLAWTFFAALGVTELAHLVVFPFLVAGPLAYFPGMATVVALAPVAWWGMWRLTRAPARAAA